MIKLSRADLLVFLSFLILMALAAAIFNLGVNESFYFDDYINLSALSQTGGVDDWESVKAFVLGNTSGAGGRPISMASFLLNDNSWPSMAADFKRTNIFLHILNGLLLFWFVLLLVRADGNKSALKVAAFVAAVWVFNPLHVSTVLYPVQRMAQLPTVFTLLAMIFFLKGRFLVAECDRRFFIMFLAVILFFFMGVYSKENGALIPVFLIFLELWIARYLMWRMRWVKVCFWIMVTLAAFVIAYIIISPVIKNGLHEVYPGRSFTPYDRLISQPYVLMFYFKELIFPSLYTSGLYYDDWRAFSSFWDARVITGFFCVFLLIFFSVILFVRRFYSGFAILFFFAGHIIESTGLNLELVFEHRNYLPSLFLGFLWLDLVCLVRRFSKASYLILIIPLVAFPLFSADRSSLWRSKLEFSRYLVQEHPFSVRSHVELNNTLLSLGMISEAKTAISEAMIKNPENSYLAIHGVLVDCVEGKADEGRLDNLIKNAVQQPFDGRNAMAFQRLYEYMEGGKCDNLTPEYFGSLISAYLSHLDRPNKMIPASKRLLQVYADKFYIGYPDHAPNGVIQLAEVLKKNDPEYLMSVAASLANLSRYKEAILLSDRALELVRSGVLGEGGRAQADFEREIMRFQDIVKADAQDRVKNGY